MDHTVLIALISFIAGPLITNLLQNLILVVTKKPDQVLAREALLLQRETALEKKRDQMVAEMEKDLAEKEKDLAERLADCETLTEENRALKRKLKENAN